MKQLHVTRLLIICASYLLFSCTQEVKVGEFATLIPKDAAVQNLQMLLSGDLRYHATPGTGYNYQITKDGISENAGYSDWNECSVTVSSGGAEKPHHWINLICKPKNGKIISLFAAVYNEYFGVIRSHVEALVSLGVKHEQAKSMFHYLLFD